MTNKNSMILSVLLALVVGVAAFFGGMQYQKTKVAGSQKGFGRGQGRQFQGANGQRINAQGATPVRGEIIGQDEKSIIVKMQDGSSKIIILSSETTINKATEGTKNDLKNGEMINAFGKINPDGSITAQTISIGGGMFRGIPNGQQRPSMVTPTN